MEAKDINAIESESGVIATLIKKPDFSFYSEQLLPNHFTSKQNRYIYSAICDLAKKGVAHIDAYNIIEDLSSQVATKNYSEFVTLEQVQELVDVSDILARGTVEEYKLLVDNVLDSAFRKDVYQKLKECEALCLNLDTKNIEQEVYKAIDDVMLEFSSTTYIPQYKDIVDELWQEIEDRQSGESAGMPFKFKTLNNYVTIEPGELVVFGGTAKGGKSMMLLNCAVDLLKQSRSVLYIDSELNSRMFTARLLSHLSGIEFGRVKSGRYDETEKQRILEAKEWMKTRNFVHVYIPFFDIKNVYTTVKKVNHIMPLDVLIVDYFKSSDSPDAYENYSVLGKLVNVVKNEICGDMNIAGLAAAQTTSDGGRLADSAKIARNASTIVMIRDKLPEEIESDGVECGNKKLIVTQNRNGMQHAPGEYIDIQFTGNLISFEEAKQHIPTEPY